MSNKVIYKYPLEPVKYQFVEMPKSATILKCAAQWNDVCLWALVDERDTEEVKQQKIVTVMAGEVFDDSNLTYLDTVLLERDETVVHVFEDTRQRR